MEDKTWGGYLRRRNEELRTASSYPHAPAFPPEASMSSETSKSPEKPGQNAAGQEEGTEKCANEALLVEHTELTRNDDGQGLADDSQGGDASAKQTSLTVDMVVVSDADNSDEVLNSRSGKSSCSGKSNRGGKLTIDEVEASYALEMLRRRPAGCYLGGAQKSGNETPVTEEEELSRKHSRQALADCPEKSAVIQVERKKPKLDHEVLDNSVVMQEEKQMVHLDAPAPSNSSEEESSDIVDGEANRTA